MSLFTVEQYDKAIEALQAARKQLVDGTQSKGCAVCGGACHPDQCGWNPLYAQHLCNTLSDQAHDMHHTLHRMAGFDTYMGESVGIGRVKAP